MPTKAQQVREALATEVKKVAALKLVQADGFWKLWNQEPTLPAAYVILDDDESEPGPTQSKTVHARYRIAVTLASERPQDEFDDIRGAIETEIEDDPTLGGLAMAQKGAIVSGVGRFATAKSISGDFYVRDIFVDVDYYHPRAQP